MARTRLNKAQKKIPQTKEISFEASKHENERKENHWQEKNALKNKSSNIENKTCSEKKKDMKEQKGDTYSCDIEAFLRGDITTIDNINSLADLRNAKEAYKKQVKKILNIKRKEMLENLKLQRMELIEAIPDGVKEMPFICFLIGLKNNYVGEEIIAKNKIDSVKRKPSIIVKIEDQTITIDGSDVKVEGNKKTYNNKFINEIKNLYDNYYGGNKKK